MTAGRPEPGGRPQPFTFEGYKMRLKTLISVAAILTGTTAFAEQHGASTGYMAGDLLSPCQEADNDARWGEAAETECEQYLIGFVDALLATGAAGPGTQICPPMENTADEVRWAFMRWVHGSYGKRTRMSAAEAVMGTLSETFPCGQ